MADVPTVRALDAPRPGPGPSLAATIAPMDDRASARRDLALLATAVIAVSRLADPPLIGLVALGLLAAVAVGAVWVLGEAEPRGVAVEALILPSLAAVAGLLALRLVPVGPILIVAVPLAFLLVMAALTVEARLESRPSTPTTDPTTVLGVAVLVAFLCFSGIAVLTGVEGVDGEVPASSWSVTIAVLVDSAVAFLLGYRLTALRTTDVRRVLPAAGTYAAAIAVAAGALAILDLPGVVGPALLALVLFLWDGLRGTTSGGIRDARSIWQIVLLAILGLLVIALNVRQIA